MIGRLLRRPLPEVPRLPPRVGLTIDDSQVLDIVMHEYEAIHLELQTSVSNQVSILSFGAATTGLLVAAAGAVWADEPLLAGLLLLVIVPAASFLLLVLHAGELVRTFRAGLFLHELENHINGARRASAGQDVARVLTWEQWAIRHGGPDMSRQNRRAITLVFGLQAFGFIFAGYWRLHSMSDVSEVATVAALTVSLALGLYAVRWVLSLYAYAYEFRGRYRLGGAADGDDGDGTSAGPTGPPPAPATGAPAPAPAPAGSGRRRRGRSRPT